MAIEPDRRLKLALILSGLIKKLIKLVAVSSSALVMIGWVVKLFARAVSCGGTSHGRWSYP